MCGSVFHAMPCHALAMSTCFVRCRSERMKRKEPAYSSVALKKKRRNAQEAALSEFLLLYETGNNEKHLSACKCKINNLMLSRDARPYWNYVAHNSVLIEWVFLFCNILQLWLIFWLNLLLMMNHNAVEMSKASCKPTSTNSPIANIF